MGTEQEKAEAELAVFGEFISKAGISIDPGSVSKPGTQSEPDIFCTLRKPCKTHQLARCVHD